MGDLRATIVFLQDNPDNDNAKTKLSNQIVSIKELLKREGILIERIGENESYQILKSNYQFEPNINLAIYAIAQKVLLELDAWLERRFDSSIEQNDLNYHKSQMNNFYSNIYVKLEPAINIFKKLISEHGYFVNDHQEGSILWSLIERVIKMEIENTFFWGNRSKELIKGYNTYGKYFTLNEREYKSISNNQHSPIRILTENITTEFRKVILKKSN